MIDMAGTAEEEGKGRGVRINTQVSFQCRLCIVFDFRGGRNNFQRLLQVVGVRRFRSLEKLKFQSLHK